MPDGDYSEIPSYKEREEMLHRLPEIIEHLKKTKTAKLHNSALRQLWIVNKYKSDPDDINHEYDHEKYGLASSCNHFFPDNRPSHVSEVFEQLDNTNPLQF